MPVPYILLTRSDNRTAKLGTYGNLVLSEFVRGDLINRNKGSSVLPTTLTVSIAETIANIHRVSQIMDVEHKLDHPLSARQTIAKNNSEVKLSKYALAPVRQIMIHGDLTSDNIFVDRSHNTVKAIIDFGDSHYDYLTYDIAILLTHVYVTKSQGIDFKGIAQFLTTYNQLNPLKYDEIKTILPMMELRNMALMQYVDSMPVKDNSYRKALEIIRQSSEARLDLLKKHEDRLEGLILSS